MSLQKQVLIFHFQFTWVLFNTARVSSFCFNVRQNAVALAVEDRSWLLSASSVTLMMPSLSALIVASKSNFCFSTFSISLFFIFHFKSALLLVLSSAFFMHHTPAFPMSRISSSVYGEHFMVKGESSFCETLVM